jgi:hypothetical protein
MGATDVLDSWLRDPAHRAAIAAAAEAGERRLAADARPAAVRHVLADDVELDVDGLLVRSVWLVSHRGLRRAGLRAHPASAATLVAWRGEGLVLLRGAGARRSVALGPWDAAPAAADLPHVLVPEATPFDTLAESSAWHLLAFHSHRAAGLERHQLERRDDTEIWVDHPEEDPS